MRRWCCLRPSAGDIFLIFFLASLALAYELKTCGLCVSITEIVAVLRAHGQTSASLCGKTMRAARTLGDNDDVFSIRFRAAGMYEGLLGKCGCSFFNLILITALRCVRLCDRDGSSVASSRSNECWHVCEHHGCYMPPGSGRSEQWALYGGWDLWRSIYIHM